MIAIISLCLSFIQFTTSFSTDWSTEFDYNTYIDEDQLFKLYWTDLEDDIIEFGIEVKATGWIALGVSPRGQMPNSDIAIGWVNDYGDAFIQDRYANGRSAPLYDNQQNLTLIEGEEADGMTRLRFQRPKYSCDNDDLSLSQGTTRLIWAFHSSSDPEEECFDSSSITMHTNMGSQSINLDTGVPEEVELEDDVETMEFVMTNVSIPDEDTTYYCKLFEIPAFDETQYAVKFETIVEEGNEALVHHLVAYYCPVYLAEADHTIFEDVCDNYDTNMPSRDCRGGSIIYVWAVGGNDLYMPEVAAMPFSGDSNLHYILLEMHYDNPLEKSGLVDSSGFRMYYTPTAREYDVAVLQVGLDITIWGQYIPQGLDYAHNSAFMPSQCSEGQIPDDGINVFGSFLHQHTIGRASAFRHIRNGVELAPIDYNLNYDFNYQQTILFDEPILLHAGDEFIMDCYTNSSTRTEYTTGGESSSQEMCFAFILYYPAIPLKGATTWKEYGAFTSWVADAFDEGYFDANVSDLNALWNEGDDYILNMYNSDMDGALEFYNRLWSVDYPEYNKHGIWCDDQNNSAIYFNWSIARDESFVKYELQDTSCNNTIDDDDAGSVGVCTPSPTMNPITTTDNIENPSNANCNAFIKALVFIICLYFFFIF